MAVCFRLQLNSGVDDDGIAKNYNVEDYGKRAKKQASPERFYFLRHRNIKVADVKKKKAL